jgi:lambda repressor-like predicted transcriptional regulator
MATHRASYPNALRACIRQAGYSFREVSRETTIPESTLYDWAAGNRPIPHCERKVLVGLLGCDEHDLKPQYDYDMLQLPQDDGLSSLGREMNRKRRELLQLLGFAGSMLLLPLHLKR